MEFLAHLIKGIEKYCICDYALIKIFLLLLSIETIEPEYEDEEKVVEITREEKSIDPLVVDIERKPFKPDFSDMEDSKKPSGEEQPEGRFFLKDKLCALGLADVSIFINFKML